VMRMRAFWDDPSHQRCVLARLPAYRLSKFQCALPERYALEMIRAYLLDIPGTVRWLQAGVRESISITSSNRRGQPPDV
jgi:ATP-dependent Lhr-like helicase